MMSLTFYVVILVITLGGAIAGLITLVNGEINGLFGLLLCGFLSVYWGIQVANYDENKEKSEEKVRIVSVQTTHAPQIDTIVTNRTDTLYISNFTGDFKIKK